MIIDFQSDPDHARRFDVATGKPIEPPVWYANDVTELCRAYRRIPGRVPGTLVFEQDPVTGRPIPYEFTRPILIVAKPPGELAELVAAGLIAP
jgi:hypothetical protein